MNASLPFSLEDIQQAAQNILKNGVDLRDKIKALTTQALSQGELAEAQVREVLKAITEGVSLGATEKAEDVKTAVTEAMHGVDDALGHAVTAVEEAVVEVANQVKAHHDHELKPTLEELKTLRAMLKHTLSRVSESTVYVIKHEIHELKARIDEAREDTSGRVKDVAVELGDSLRSTTEEAVDAGKHAALEIGARVGHLASRKLSEIASKLEEKAKALKQGHPF